MFNRLELAEDGLQLFVDIDVRDLEYYKDAKIVSIELDTADSYSESTGRAYTYELKNKSDHYIGRLLPANFSAGGESPKSFGDIVYITVNFEGIEKPCKPCGVEPRFCGIAVNWKKIYRQGLAYLSELSSNCGEYRDFLDWALHLKAFKLAVAFGDIIHANKYFKEWFSTRKGFTKGCGCRK